MNACVLLAVLMVAVPSAIAWAQDAPAPVAIDALVDASWLGPSQVTFTPDGTVLAYTVVDGRRAQGFDGPKNPRTGVPWYAFGSDVWIASIGGSDHRNVSRGQGNNWGPSWSPDGRRLAFLSDRTVSGDSTGAVHLWLWERASGTLRQVGDVPLWPSQLEKLGSLEWTAGGRAVVVKLAPEDVKQRSGFHAATRPPARDTGLTVRVFSFDPTAQDSVPRTDYMNLDKLRGDLASIDIATGAVRRFSRGARIGTYVLSPDRRKLAWVMLARFARPGSYQILADLVVCDLETGTSRRLVTEAPLASESPHAQLTWAPDSRALAYRPTGVGVRDEIYVVSVAGGAPRRIAEGPVLDDRLLDALPVWDSSGQQVFFVRDSALWRAPADGGGASRLAVVPERQLRMIDRERRQLWSPDGGRTTVVITTHPGTKRAGLARVDLQSGTATQLLEEDKVYGELPIAVVPDGRAIVYLAEDSRHPPNLWLARADGAPRPRQLTQVAGGLARFGTGVVRLIAWSGLDGDTLRGALLYPAAYRPETRYPLIVKVYGGFDVSGELHRFGLADGLIENLQVFASRGYAVLLADSRLNVGTPMLDLAKTVLPGVDKVIELGVADPNRIGITGHSYGGYSTLALITQSRRFRAAVMRAGLGDLVSAYGSLSPDGTNHMLSWAERGQGRMGGTPWEVRERYIENSPIFYLDRVVAPVLIIHGEADTGPQSFLADQVFTGLRRLGKRVEYARYAGEDHWEGTWSRANQLDYLRRTIAWFDRYLKPARTVGR